ncbi:hypothetical protein Sf12_gp20 [Shigella phage Sf12]|uniref:Uncharacterized protein n=1 Tax=Shigella phage Sf12 TaxID=2024315 RepID=A0A291AXJ4_9CAUD|nr:hypothetical protein HOR99_gp19 [Shigella phage Sf12]ATE85746.1 hypothetical protein Sf12_gp20 [Shigella phage Sf12]
MKLTFETKWELFQGLAAKKLVDKGFNQDPLKMASCLDMSFEEGYMHADLNDWEDMMQRDIEEFKEDAPQLFAEIQ